MCMCLDTHLSTSTGACVCCDDRGDAGPVLARLRQEASTAAGRPLVVAADFTVLSRLGAMDFGAVSERAPFRGSWNEYSLREDVFWYLSLMPGASTLEHACVRLLYAFFDK